LRRLRNSLRLLMRKGKLVFGLLGKKLGMTQIFTDEGNLVPVTVIEVGPCVVTQVKTKECDGYEAVQLAFEDKKRNVTKPLQGHFKKAGVSPKRRMKEFSISGAAEMKPGAEIKADIFQEGERVDVKGVTKGKGFAGVVRRHGFGGGPASHGHTSHRRVGSIGQCADPSEVWKGVGMPGQMGSVRRTVQNLQVVKIDTEKNLLFVRGSVPGANGRAVEVFKAVKGPGKAPAGKAAEGKK
jgi:large subunit ribosomal protein L3